MAKKRFDHPNGDIKDMQGYNGVDLPSGVRPDERLCGKHLRASDRMTVTRSGRNETQIQQILHDNPTLETSDLLSGGDGQRWLASDKQASGRSPSAASPSSASPARRLREPPRRIIVDRVTNIAGEYVATSTATLQGANVYYSGYLREAMSERVEGMDPDNVIEESERVSEEANQNAQDALQWFLDSVDGLIEREEARERLAEHLDVSEDAAADDAITALVGDIVDPVQQITTRNTRYVGIIDYHEWVRRRSRRRIDPLGRTQD